MLTIKEASQVSGKSVGAIWAAISRGRLKARGGTRVRTKTVSVQVQVVVPVKVVDRADLDEWSSSPRRGDVVRGIVRRVVRAAGESGARSSDVHRAVVDEYGRFSQRNVIRHLRSWEASGAVERVRMRGTVVWRVTRRRARRRRPGPGSP